MAKTKIAVLISGRGSNMQALIEAAKNETFPAEIVLVASNNPDAPGLAIAEAAGIETDVIDHRDHDSRESFEEALDFSPPSQDALSQLAGDGLDTRAKRANADEVLSRAVCPLPSCPRPRACHIAVEGVRVGGLGEGEGYHGHPREARLSRSSGVTLAGEAFILAHLWPGPTHM